MLYAGTFSKMLYPGIRLAYLVVPQEQVATFERVGRALFAAAAPAMTQAILAQFMSDGHFARHIQRMRRLYSERRAQTMAALERGLQGCVRVEPSPGGMHLVLRLPSEASDRRLAEQLLQEGMAVQPLSPWWVGAPQGPAILASFTNCPQPEQAERLGELVRLACQGRH